MIELQSVTKQYLYGARLFGNFDLKIADGEIFAVLGDEQSGKTSLIKTIGGVTDCEGRVLINGKDVCTKTDDVIIIFDDLALFENRTFYYNLAYPLKIRGYDKQKIDEAVQKSADRMGIVACLDERVKKMPLIDRKRLAVARLFLRDAKVVLIDNITKGLCASEERELWGEVAPILIEKARQGVSVVFATDKKGEAVSIADRIAVLHYGDVKQVGSVQDICEQPANVWAAQAMDADYRFERVALREKDGKCVALFDAEARFNPDTLQKDTEEKIEVALPFEKEDVVDGYIGKDVYIGWNCQNYDLQGGRKTTVKYALADGDGYVLVCENGLRIASKDKLDSVGTLPNGKGVCLFDGTNENSILKKYR